MRERPKKQPRPGWGHLAIRGIQDDDLRVLYACGDSVRYERAGGRASDTTERGARATSHTFELDRPLTCDRCDAERLGRSRR